MNDNGSKWEEIDPAERASVHVDAIRRRWWLVVGLALAAGAVAFMVSSSQTKLYDASAQVVLSSTEEPVNVLLHATTPQSLDPERDLSTSVALVKLDRVAGDVRKQLRLPLTTPQLLARVSAAPVGTSNIVAITARSESPKSAAAIANAFAVRYVATLRNQAQEGYQEAAQLARHQLASLGPRQRRGAHGAMLLTQLNQLEVTGALQTGGARFVDPATPPTSPASPRPKFATAVGVFLGLLLGALAAMSLGAAARRRARVLEPKPVTTNGATSAGLAPRERDGTAAGIGSADGDHR
jgi:uncharacterized protein involved in exopolysaccharide biosynthesis